MTFRSQDMVHYQMLIPRQGAWEVVNQLGQIDLAHIVDCSDPNSRPFFSQLKRCDQSLQKLQLLHNALKIAEIKPQQYDETEKMFTENLHDNWKNAAANLRIEPMRLIDQYEGQVIQQWNRYQDIISRIQKLKQTRKIALEKIACYEIAAKMFGQQNMRELNENYYANSVGDYNSGNNGLSGISYMVGVLPPEAEPRLSRMVYRVSRGYACVRTMNQFTFKALQNFNQTIVLLMFPSSSSQILSKKLKKVLQTFCSNNFMLSQLYNIDMEMKTTIKDFEEVNHLVELNEKQLKGFFQRISRLNFLENWRIYFWKEKHLYSILDKMDIRDQFFRVQFYVPQEFVTKLTASLNYIRPTPSINVLPLGKPPTAFQTTHYTAIAQQITDTYGVPRYKQINPSIFTTVTFPFFFGVMFGDIAHGGVLFAFGLYLVLFDQKVKKTSFKMFSQMRYMIVMMGFFAFYCGWIYNDFMAMNINVFGSCYEPPSALSPDDKKSSQAKPIHPISSDCIYPFGIDPVWGRSQNELVYINALKMKLSVIIAVVHMSVGVAIKAFNSIFFKKYLDLFCEFFPQFILLVSLFGYMDFLIVFKWLKDWSGSLGNSPSIIGTMMNIGLNVGKTSTKDNDGNGPMWGQKGDTSQDTIQLMILFIAVICIPWMLLPKPIIQIRRIKKPQVNKKLGLTQFEEDIQASRNLIPLNASSEEDHDSHGQQHQDAGQIFVHQLIQTIQFVLGTVSNTASYLRLWALSLAHSQLAKVFFQKTLATGFGLPAAISIPMLLIGFYALVWITFGILMCMDTMQCFLHSLRLHWVEFQNKFYKGDGYKYQPFSFKKTIAHYKANSQG